MGRRSRKALSIVLSGLLATSMSMALPGVARAEELDSTPVFPEEQVTELTTQADEDATQVTELTTQADEDATQVTELTAQVEEATVQATALPAKFDLRERGVVTPVKWQNPWGSCWSFGGIAAAETSILSTLGMTCDSYKATTGHDFDLSEKHLIWYSLHPVTESTNPTQVGEGLYPNGVTGRNAAYSAGGESYLVAGLFAAGIGPVNEDAYPYQGKEGFTEKDFVTKDEYKERALEVFGSEEAYQAERTKQLNKTYGAFSANDDWTIDEFNEAGETNRDVYSGYTLVNGNHLPEYAVKDGEGKWTGFNPDSMAAVKSELYAGRGVSGAFCADDALPDQETSDKGYMDTHNWAHYTDKDGENVTHCLCIVGWDDNYPKGNFADGHEPPADGAWIVKNSWGSETEYITLADGQTIGNKPWGYTNEEGKHTGYFYLSYYDKSLTSLETMEFATDLYDTGGDMSVWMYDYLPSNYDALKMQEDSVIRTANVFPNSSGRQQTLQAVSTKTAYADASVTYSMYRLGKDAKNPEDGELLGTKTASYAYAGFHREALDGSIVLRDGETLSIVVTETSKGEGGATKYDIAASNARTQASAQEINDGFYGVSKVNKGESFIYRNGAWSDWTESDLIPEFNEATQNMFVTDNFSIKAYMIAQDEPEPTALALTGSGHVQTYGDVTAKASGKGIAIGTTGEAKRLEQFTVSLPKDTNGGIEYRAHLQRIGWGDWVQGGKPCGTTGEARRLEAVQMRLTGALAKTHSVWYRVHSQTWGTLGWAKDGQAAGTSGQAKRAEAVEVQVLPQGQVPEGYEERQASYVGAVSADVHLQKVGWTGASSALEFGTTGQARRLEAVRISGPATPVSAGISYEVHVQREGWMTAAADGALAGTTGQAKRLEAVRISLTGDAAKDGNYPVWYRVHSQTFGGLGWTCDGEPAGTTGLAKRAEAIDVQVLPQGQVPRGYDAGKAACVNG